MSVPQMRRFLKDLTLEEWRQVLDSAHEPWTAVMRSGAKAAQPDEKTVRQWVLVPHQSNELLDLAVEQTANDLLPDAGEDGGKTLPADPESLRDWIADVSATYGPGPAKICLLAAMESAPGVFGSVEVADLLALIAATPPIVPESHPVTDPTDPDDEAGGPEAAADEDLNALASQLAQLESTATATAARLRDVAASVEAGRGASLDAEGHIETFVAARSLFLQQLSGSVAAARPADFDECHAELDRERDARAETRRREREAMTRSSGRIEGLMSQVHSLDAWIPSADPSLVVGLKAVRATATRELAGLGVDLDSEEGDQGHHDPVLQPDEDPGAHHALAGLAPGEGEAGVVEPEPVVNDTTGEHGGTPTGPSGAGRAELGVYSSPLPTGELLGAAGHRAEPDPALWDPSRPAPGPTPAASELSAAPPASDGSETKEPGGALDGGAVAMLVACGRPLAAAWLVRAGGSDPLLVDALVFNGVAFACGIESVSPLDAVMAGADLSVETLSGNRPAAIAAMTGAARAGLAAGWTAGHLLDGLLGSVHLETKWHAMMTAVIDVSRHGYQHTTTRRSAPAGVSRADYGDRARTLAFELGAARTKYHRATRVLHHLARSDEPLGAALRAVEDWSKGDDAAIGAMRDCAAEFRNQRSRTRILGAADERVSTPQQRRNDIVAGAAQQLHSRIDEVSDLLAEALEVAMTPRAVAASNEAVRARLVAAATTVGPSASPRDVETALLEALRRWILDPSGERHEEGNTVEELWWCASLPLVDLSRDSAQVPDLDGVALESISRALMDPPPVESLVEHYLTRGNLRAAAVLAEHEAAQMNRVTDARDGWRARLTGMARDVETQLARARSHHAMTDEGVSETEGRLKALADYEGDRYDLQVEELDDAKAVVAESLLEEAGRLRLALEHVGHRDNPDDVERVRGLLEAGDLSTAREYIFQLERGTELPEAVEPGEGTLESFNAVVSRLPADARRAQDVYQRVVDGSDEDALSAAGLQAWAGIVLTPLRTSRRELPALLSLIGLESDRSRISEVRDVATRSAKVFDVRAQPRDGSIVPGLGSRAGGQYYVTVVSSQRLDPEQALRLIPESRRNQANLLLVPQMLTQQERRQFLLVAREQDVKVLVVDSACVGYVAGTAPGSFRALQQVTLPYATYTHYTPFVAGDVPDEVFVGRTDEAQQVIDPAGSLFVYGGRQLGKSALLRHIARTSSDGRARHAIYVDLKAKMIGEAQDPAYLWVVLLEEFKRAGIIGSKVTSGTAKSVVEHTKAWLQEDETRRVLLLLDEADLFLESEARQRREGQRVVRFANVSPLKDLMESTNRRFKPVFAGLHQVQRFHEISNTPLAHGGKDILVGPLDRNAAFDLVEKPFAALGYRFESRDLISRILAYTNYQASLVQIVCDHLARRMAKRPLRAGQPPVTITSSDVDRVTEDHHVRHQLAERFRLTIALEDRYLVIALVVASFSFEDNFTEAYEPTDIFEWCREYWPGGFGDMTLREFRLYLEEMDGLGVLVRRKDGRIAVRSPNVVSMLGDKSDVEQHLIEGAERFELPHDYNPRVSRRIARVGSADVRSPLTEQDLQILLPKTGGMVGLHLVVGSPALGVHHVADVLKTVAAERQRATTLLGGDELGAWVTSSGGATRRDKDALPIVDATRLDAQAVKDLLDLARRTVDRRTGQSIIVIVGPTAAGMAESWQPPRVASVTMLTRWNDEALRSMSDAVFVGIADYRAEILGATSGWPARVEEVLRRGSDGEPLNVIIASARQWPGTSSAAAGFLRDVGVHDDAERLRQWTDAVQPGEAVDTTDLQALFPEAPTGTFAEVAGRLAVLQVVTGEPSSAVLDPLVHRTVRHLADAGS